MLTGSKIADSTITSFVASDTSDDAPPITPAIAERPARVGDEQRLGVQRAVDVVERLDALALPARAGPRCRPALPVARHRAGIERVDRLAELDHHVVRGVDDVADRADAAASRRIWTQSGDGPTVTPSIQRPTKRGHSRSSSTVTVSRSVTAGAALGDLGRRQLDPRRR